MTLKLLSGALAAALGRLVSDEALCRRLGTAAAVAALAMAEDSVWKEWDGLVGFDPA